MNVGRVLEHLYDYIYVFEPSETTTWRRFHLRCEDLVSDTGADDAIITFDLMNFTGGNIDGSWTDSDYATAVSQFNIILNAWAGLMSGGHQFTEVKAYVMGFNPEWAGSLVTSDLEPFVESGGPDYAGALNAVGTGSLALPSQVSFSVTEETPVRRNWGRFYLPWPSGNSLGTSSGRFSSTTITTIVNAVHSAYNNLAGVELFPIVVHTYQNKARVAAWSQVTGLRGDDIPDIIRRRRPKDASFIHRMPVTAGTQPAGD